MGKKYIIELKDNTAWLQWVNVVDDGQVRFDFKYPEDLTPYTEPDMEQVRKEAYDKGYDDATAEIGSDEQAIAEKAYQKGLSDAWEAARKICTNWVLPDSVLSEIFGMDKTIDDIMKESTASEAIEKIRQYEQEKEEQIQIGDEVTPRETEYDDMIVTRLWKDDYDSDCIDAIGFDGRIGSFLVSRVSKTGKHYEIAEVLAKMKESEP